MKATPSNKERLNSVSALAGARKMAAAFIAVGVVAVCSIGFGAETAFATGISRPSCPLVAGPGRTVVQFTGRIVSEQNFPGVGFETPDVSVGLPAGDYRVELFSWDGYHGRDSVSQPNERWFVKFKGQSGTLVESAPIRDVQDRVTSATVREVVNTSLSIPSGVTRVSGYHAVYPDNSSPNSVEPVCASFELITVPLDGVCNVNPTSGRVGDTFHYAASAFGGNGSFSYSWTGTDSLGGSSADVFRQYTTSGTKTAIVQIRSGSLDISRTCTVTVQDLPPPPSVSCEVGPMSGRIGDRFVWRASVVNAIGTPSYSWSGTDGLDGSAPTVDKSYSSAGTKNGTVSVTVDGNVFTRTCNVVVIEDEVMPPDCPISPAANRTIVQFNRSRKIVSDSSRSNAESGPISTFLQSGSYQVTLAAWDGYIGRENALQPREEYGVELRRGGNLLITSGTTGDLADRVRSASRVDLVNTRLALPNDADSILALHSAYPDTSSPNSLAPICASFERVTDSLDGFCTVTPTSGRIGDTFRYSAAAQGGTGFFTFNWSGTDNLSGSTSEVLKQYFTPGSKSASVVIRSGSAEITHTCSVEVQDTPPPSVSCDVSPSSGRIGDRFTWRAFVATSHGSPTYSWTGTDGLSGTSQSVGRTYSTTGTKFGTVAVTIDGVVFTRLCSINVTADEILSPSVVPYCLGFTPKVRISWNDTGRGSNGFRVILDNDTSDSNGGWERFVSSGTLSIDGPDSFSSFGNASGNLNLSSGSTYYVRVVYQSSGESSPWTSFVATSCGGGAFDAFCSVTPSSGRVNDVFTWTAFPSGGTGSYTYSWGGTDGLSGSSQVVQKVYAFTGQKSATVIVTSGSNSVSRTCVVDVQSLPTGCQTLCGRGGLEQPRVIINQYRQPNEQPYAFVYLSQVPYTGFDGGAMRIVIPVVLTLLAGGSAVMIARRRRSAKVAGISATMDVPMTATPLEHAKSSTELAIDKGMEFWTAHFGKTAIAQNITKLRLVEEYATGRRVVLSVDAATVLIKVAHLNEMAPLTLCGKVIEVLRGNDEGEWMTLTVKNLTTILQTLTK